MPPVRDVHAREQFQPRTDGGEQIAGHAFQGAQHAVDAHAHLTAAAAARLEMDVARVGGDRTRKNLVEHAHGGRVATGGPKDRRGLAVRAPQVVANRFAFHRQRANAQPGRRAQDVEHVGIVGIG